MARAALITGASKGLGFTLASLLAGQGYDLIITARREDELQQAADRLREAGAKVIAVAGDVTEASHREALIAEARALGRLQLLVNNASTVGPSPMPTLAETPLGALRDVVETNFIAPIGLVQGALSLLKAGDGLVINISSDAARGGYETWGSYGASKAALDLASLTLANELEDAGIGVVSVDPGDMRTELAEIAFEGDVEDRPLPDVTLPFWMWLLGQDRLAVSGQRYEAQAEQWEVRHEA
jgi:NAD(P)-dependent dehydrogenase (short-subunit alcohol dehydrogenase family)